MLTLVLWTTGVTKLSAQNIGIKGGLNHSNLSSEVRNGSSWKSFHLGFMGSLRLSDNINFQPELIYSQQGSIVGHEEPTEYHYLNVPLLLVFRTKRKLSFHAGPQLGFLLSDCREPQFPITPFSPGAPADTDLGLSIGLGYKALNRLTLTGRYTYGFVDIKYFRDRHVANRVFQISIEWSLFNLNKPKNLNVGE